MLHLTDSPLLFCFFKDGWFDDELCSPEDLETWLDGTVMIAGEPCFATVTAVFFPTFFDPSEEAGGAPSSCSFLLVVLFG